MGLERRFRDRGGRASHLTVKSVKHKESKKEDQMGHVVERGDTSGRVVAAPENTPEIAA